MQRSKLLCWVGLNEDICVCVQAFASGLRTCTEKSIPKVIRLKCLNSTNLAVL